MLIERAIYKATYGPYNNKSQRQPHVLKNENKMDSKRETHFR